MIPRSQTNVEPSLTSSTIPITSQEDSALLTEKSSITDNNWKKVLAGASRTPEQLLNSLELSATSAEINAAEKSNFPLLVPQPFIDKMEKGNRQDPLLLQVLPSTKEFSSPAGFSLDPLAEKHSNNQQGIIHKYHGRVLLLVAAGCAVNCRYCFRRHFPYHENRVNQQQWQQTLDYLRQQTDISEVILSGGDPLLLDDKAMAKIVEQLETIPQLKRLRIHSRLPVVIPQRLTSELSAILSNSRLTSTLVLHINHANEIDQLLSQALKDFKTADITLLNQSVLLKDVNDNGKTLINLSEKLFQNGILPYYLHLLDKVAGAAHFNINMDSAKNIYSELLSHLPGYLVPKLVREEAAKSSKTPINVSI